MYLWKTPFEHSIKLKNANILFILEIILCCKFHVLREHFRTKAQLYAKGLTLYFSTGDRSRPILFIKMLRKLLRKIAKYSVWKKFKLKQRTTSIIYYSCTYEMIWWCGDDDIKYICLHISLLYVSKRSEIGVTCEFDIMRTIFVLIY